MHDFLLDLRGAERVFDAVCRRWPDAEIFTAVYDEEGTEGRFAGRTIHTSFLQRVHPTARTFRALFPLYPNAIESLDLRGFDVVISSSSAWAHGVCAPDAVHVCYCHNPFRYAWSERDSTLAARNPVTRPILRPLLDRWRGWDRAAARRVDRYVANSAVTAERLDLFFGRESTVLHPPVELARFGTDRPLGDHYLVVAELMPHKRIDVAVRAFNRLGRRLVVVGDGPEERRLRRLAGPTVELRGRLGDEEVAELMSTCQALVVCAVEEFGIAAVEAQAAGRPVIALGSGGVVETVRPGVTGVFFEHASPDALAHAVRAFDPASSDPDACQEVAAGFSVERFQESLAAIVEETIAGQRRVSTTNGPIRPLSAKVAAR